MAGLREQEVVRVDRRTVQEGNGFDVGVDGGGDLPLVGGADLCEGPGAVADERQRVSRSYTVAGELMAPCTLVSG